ncbi:glycoside hydrolase family 18 protein [Mycena filopes]|nr:glycoside hydrolase family 18 protein [Mycena filopes]
MHHSLRIIPFALLASVSANVFANTRRSRSPLSLRALHHNRAPIAAPSSEVILPRVDATSEVITSAWYPSWGTVAPADLSWHQYTHMVYAFGITTEDPSNITGLDRDLLTAFVQTAQANGVSPMLSIGGWTGSKYFSTAVATSANREKFTTAILKLVTDYALEGIDFDWEYPAQAGIGCNVHSPADSANFLLLLTRPTLQLTAAVASPFTGSDGAAMSDVSAFAAVLDRIELMVYDTWGSSKAAGPNAPLRDACAPTEYQFGSVTSMVAAWTGAKFPVEKIVLGLAAYGHSYNVTSAAAINTTGSLNAYPALTPGGAQPVGTSDSPSDVGTKDVCGNANAVSGVFTFGGLVQAGYLDANGSANYNYAVDACSGTPFVYHEDVLISYDDAKSFALKGEFINDNNLAGFAVWDATSDHDDILLDSLHAAMGIEDCADGA